MQTPASGPDWWAVGTNIATSVGTFATVAVALWVAIRDGRQQAAERLDRAAAQAGLVTCDAVDFPRITITNHSGLPILEANVIAVMSTKQRRLMAIEGKRSGTIKAGRSWRWTVPREVHSRLHLAGDERPIMSIAFVDASGVKWSRQDNLDPVRLTNARFG